MDRNVDAASSDTRGGSAPCVGGGGSPPGPPPDSAIRCNSYCWWDCGFAPAYRRKSNAISPHHHHSHLLLLRSGRATITSTPRPRRRRLIDCQRHPRERGAQDASSSQREEGGVVTTVREPARRPKFTDCCVLRGENWKEVATVLLREFIHWKLEKAGRGILSFMVAIYREALTKIGLRVYRKMDHSLESPIDRANNNNQWRRLMHWWGIYLLIIK